MINTITESAWRRKGLFLGSYSTPEGSQVEIQGRDLEAGTEVEAMSEPCLLTCSSWCAQSTFLYHPGQHAHGWYHPQLASPSTFIINQEKFPTDLHTCHLVEAVFQLWCLFPGKSNLGEVDKTRQKQQQQPGQRVCLNSLSSGEQR